MPATKIFTIGTFTAPSTWIALIIAFLVAYIAIRFRLGKKIANILMDAVFYFIIVWKFSVILTDFSTVIKSPLSIIYFNGGLWGFYLGLIAGGCSLVLDLKKRSLRTMEVAGLFMGVMLIQVVYQIMMVLLNEGEWVAQIMTVVFFLLFAAFAWINIMKSRTWSLQFAFMFIAVHLFVAAFQKEGLTGIPVISTIGISLFFIGLLFRSHAYGFESGGQI